LAVRWEDLEGVILVVDAMKTLRRRAVEIIAPLADDLEDLRAVDASVGDLVVTSPHGLPVNLNNWRRRVFLPACERAGIDADPKDGRTSCISLMIHEGRSLAYVAASVGNSARVISDNYLHVLRAVELGHRTPMADAIYAARRNLGVRPVCADDAVIDLGEARKRSRSS
jgi:integrase